LRFHDVSLSNTKRFKSFKTFKPFNPLLHPPPRPRGRIKGEGFETSRGVNSLNGLKQFTAPLSP
jgi:hypothetical protein